MTTTRLHQKPDARLRRAFTLLEMLIVLVIIAIIAGLALPHIRGNTESVAINAACRQLVADFSFARQMAVSRRSTVVVVFLSPDILGTALLGPGYAANETAEIKRLQAGVCTHYALYQYRRPGEQPGTSGSDGYITEWKSLPDKTFINREEFYNFSAFRYSDGNPNFNPAPKFRFPFSSSPSVNFGSRGLPYIAFDHEGRCITVDRDETGAGSMLGDRELKVSRGAIFYTRQPLGHIEDTDFSTEEVPLGNGSNNIIYINALTGRAKRLEQALK